MKILNLGCGTKVSSDPAIINIDWSIMLRIRDNPILKVAAPFILKGSRLDEFRSLGKNILVHDLSKGIPFPDNSVDAVYHSHTLEHLDRNIVPMFFAEVRRVLKKGGVHRIVIPDLEVVGKSYIAHLAACESDPSKAAQHDTYVAAIIEQCVRKEAFGTSQQRPFRRFVENALLGDARKRGQTHQWMWDRFNLTVALEETGFGEVIVQTYSQSLIPNWEQYGLEVNSEGAEYKPDSLYLDAINS